MAAGELACTYATLVLHDDGIPVTAEKIATLVKAANVSVESYWPSLFAKLAEKRNIDDLLFNFGSGGGAAPVAAVSASAPGAGGAVAAAPAAEEKKEEAKEESDDDIVEIMAHFRHLENPTFEAKGKRGREEQKSCYIFYPTWKRNDFVGLFHPYIKGPWA